MSATKSSLWPWAMVGGAALGVLVLSRRSNAAVVSGGFAPTRVSQREGLEANNEALLAHARPVKAVSRAYDSIFERYGHGLPVAYLRSLAKRESDLNPGLADGPAWGILQVVEVVRSDYNERHQAAYSRKDLLDPSVCTEIASDLLARIVASYAKNHPTVPNMARDWRNPRFVELLTFGWNAGYSERCGVGKVARFLTQSGMADGITIDTIFSAAEQAGASRHLSNPKKVAWCKSVARLFENEIRGD